jgi:lysozyme
MTPEGLALLKSEEGFRGYPYSDSVGFQTVGYGTRLPLIPEEAALLMQYRLDQFWAALAPQINVPLTPHQQDALMSFAYNIGPTAFEDSTLLKVLNRGHYDQVPEQMLRWVHPPELRGRREKEIALWNMP